jgi:hypothetical protein
MTANQPYLMQISRRYDLIRLWMNRREFSGSGHMTVFHESGHALKLLRCQERKDRSHRDRASTSTVAIAA